MKANVPWGRSFFDSVARPFMGRKGRRLPNARTERQLNDVKKRFGKVFIDQMDVIDIAALPAFMVSGHTKLTQRDLSLIGSVMDTHLGVGGFYVQSTALRFLVSASEVGAMPLHQAIMDELNVKLMPPAKLDTERALKDLQADLGREIVNYMQKVDLLALLFGDDKAITKVPSVIRDLSRLVMDQCLEGVGCFARTNTNEFSILFISPDPKFAQKHMPRIQKEIKRRCVNLIASYKHQQGQEKEAHFGVGNNKKDVRKAPSPSTPSAAAKKQVPQEKNWVHALANNIDSAAQGRADYKEQLANLSWDQGIRYEPILRLSTASIVGRICRPATPVVSKTEQSADGWAALPDLPLLAALIDDLHGAPADCVHAEIICIPLHFHTLSKSHYREVLFNLLGKLTHTEERFLSVELVGMGKDVAPNIIADYIRMLKPHFRTVLLQADIDGNLLEHFAGLPVHAAGFDLNFPGLSDEQRLQKIERFSERSHYYFQRTYVRGITTPALGKAAIKHEYNYISGPALGRCHPAHHQSQ